MYILHLVQEIVSWYLLISPLDSDMAIARIRELLKGYLCIEYSLKVCFCCFEHLRMLRCDWIHLMADNFVDF